MKQWQKDILHREFTENIPSESQGWRERAVRQAFYAVIERRQTARFKRCSFHNDRLAVRRIRQWAMGSPAFRQTDHLLYLLGTPKGPIPGKLDYRKSLYDAMIVAYRDLFQLRDHVPVTYHSPDERDARGGMDLSHKTNIDVRFVPVLKRLVEGLLAIRSSVIMTGGDEFEVTSSSAAPDPSCSKKMLLHYARLAYGWRKDAEIDFVRNEARNIWHFVPPSRRECDKMLPLIEAYRIYRGLPTTALIILDAFSLGVRFRVVDEYR